MAPGVTGLNSGAAALTAARVRRDELGLASDHSTRVEPVKENRTTHKTVRIMLAQVRNEIILCIFTAHEKCKSF